MKVAILTSGGDAPGMNACIRAVVRTALAGGAEVYGVYQGYDGLIKGEISKLSVSSVGDIIHRGGTMLRTARSEEFRTKEGRAKAYANLEALGIDCLFVIGGDGTLSGALALSKETGLKVYGLPGTIDNDLAYTDRTIGFDTAVNTVVDAIGKIRDTSSAMGRTTVIEVMGKNCGDIALHAGLAGGAEDILIPEFPFDLDEVCEDINRGVQRGKAHSIIIKAEGVNLSTEAIVDYLAKKTGCETKAVLLGYIQRGGSPTAADRVLASRLGHYAVKIAFEGEESSAIGVDGDTVVAIPLEEALAMKHKTTEGFMKICKALV